ncbi:MAG: hypothetical protein AAF170_04280 [Bacteroidota bacterium]
MSVLDALLLIDPAAVCPSDVDKGRTIARRVTGMIESRLRRQLIVQPAVQRVDTHPLAWMYLDNWQWWHAHAANWARQWPVVQLVTDRPFSAADPLTTTPTEVEGAGYATGERLTHPHSGQDVDLGDHTGERLGLPEAPGDGLAVYLAGYRRRDSLDDASRATVNAAIAATTPAWGAEAISEAVWARVPLLPVELASAADELARGLLSTHGTGLGAIASRTEERGESRARVQLAKGWDEEILATIDHLAWIDLGGMT